jgi:hypothetical protein
MDEVVLAGASGRQARVRGGTAIEVGGRGRESGDRSGGPRGGLTIRDSRTGNREVDERIAAPADQRWRG